MTIHTFVQPVTVLPLASYKSRSRLLYREPAPAITYRWSCDCGERSLCTFATEKEAEYYGGNHVCR